MLDLAFAKQTVDQYKKLYFTTILSKASIKSLYIQMMGRLHILLGVLGAVAKSIAPRLYNFLAIRMEGASTYRAGISPFWDVFGNPVVYIIRYAQPTGDGGCLIVLVPSEIWTNLERRNEILGISRDDYRGGVIQVEIGEEPRVILTKCSDSWWSYGWDPELEKYQFRGDAVGFDYGALGGSARREDGTAHRCLVSLIKHGEGETEKPGSWALEEDPVHSPGKIGSEETTRRAV